MTLIDEAERYGLALFIAAQYWMIACEAGPGISGRLMSHEAQDNHFETVEAIARSAYPELWNQP